MKCDELTPLVFSISDLAYVEEPTPQPNFQNPHDHAVFKATEVEEAIDELKTEHHRERHEYIEMAAQLRRENAELKNKLMPCLNGDCILTCEVVEKYGKENAELKQKLENVQASAYADSVDSGMRERRLRRALYKACANWAKCEERINNRDAYEASEYLPSAEDKFRKKAERWSEMERKCRAKAESYL